MANTRTITKALAGAEDLLFGQGSVTQTRGGQSVTVNKINAETIPYSGDETTQNVVSTKTQLDKLALPIESIQDFSKVKPETNPIVYLKSTYAGANEGAGIFVWDANTAKTEHNGGTIIDPLVDMSTWSYESSNTGQGVWKRQYDDAVNVKWFGARGDSVTDDTLAIQKALNSLKNGSSLYFPKNGGNNTGPSFYITSTLVLTANNVTLFSEGRGEYKEGFVTDKDIMILKVLGYGGNLLNLTFKGNGTATTFSTTDGILFDRSEQGDAETYSNVDWEIRGCSFSMLRTGLTGVGKNVFIFDNIFSMCKRGILGKVHTYSTGSSDFRGWRVTGNRFHSIGNPYFTSESSEIVSDTSSLDSWCIEMPLEGPTMHVEVKNNNADFCAAFYKGFLSGVTISENFLYSGMSTFIYSPVTSTENTSLSNSYPCTISNNTLLGRNIPTTAVKYSNYSEYFIYAYGSNFVNIRNNTFKNSFKEAIKISGYKLEVCGNTIHNSGGLFRLDSSSWNSLVFDSCSKITVTDNDIYSQFGSSIDVAVSAPNSSELLVKGNRVFNAITKYDFPATALSEEVDQGLPWQMPTLTNNFTLNSGKGFRKLLNGMVEVQLSLSPGDDNTACFTLPVGYRPAASFTLSSVALWATDAAYASVQTSGNIVVNFKDTPPATVELNFMFSTF